MVIGQLPGAGSLASVSWRSGETGGAAVESAKAERRRHPRYQALFPVSVILPNRGLVFGEALNVSQRAVFFMIGSQLELEPGSEAEVAMHLEFAADPDTVAERIYRGRVVRKAGLDAHQGVAVFFDEEVESGFLSKVQQLVGAREGQLRPVMSARCFIIELAGRIEPEYVGEFEESLSELAFSVTSDVIVDMARMVSLCPEALGAVVRGQKLLHSVGRSMRVVCPRCYMQGDIHSENLMRLLACVEGVYPCINTAIAAQGALQEVGN